MAIEQLSQNSFSKELKFLSIFPRTGIIVELAKKGGQEIGINHGKSDKIPPQTPQRPPKEQEWERRRFPIRQQPPEVRK